MDSGNVGKLQVISSAHWRDNVSIDWWRYGCDLNIVPENWRDSRLDMWSVQEGMVRLQHALVAAGKCKGRNMSLVGELFSVYYKSGYRKFKEYYRCPYHLDILPNWEQFADDLKSYEDGIERFSITNVMLPGSHPFFSTSIMPIITANITTITTLELQCCNLKAGDIEFISKFVQKNKALGVLNLSKNELFDNDEAEYNKASKLLSKALKKHPELSFVNLSNTGLGVNNEALELILEGSKGINSLIIDSHTFDKEGLALVTNFLQKKNAVTEISLGGGCIGKGWESRKANAKVLKQCLEKNTTLEQLCLSSNLLGIGGNDRILSTVMSGIKGSVSLVHVDLSGNEIGRVSSMKLIAKYLARNPSLIDLSLNSNGIKTNSSNILMKALKKNNNLEHLSLARNSITDKGVPAITDVLRSNNTLLTVNVQWNKLKIDYGRQELFKALCDPTSLDSISLLVEYRLSVPNFALFQMQISLLLDRF